MPSCPWPLVVPDDPSAEVVNPHGRTRCATQCDNVVYTEDEWKRVMDHYWAFSTLASLGCLFILVTWVVSKTNGTRSTQGRILYLAIANGSLALTFFMTMVSGFKKTVCKDNTTPSESGVCVFQGWLIVVSSLSTAYLWGYVAFDAYAHMLGSRRIKRVNSQYKKLIIFFCFGFPFFIGSVTAAAGLIAYGGNNSTLCFISNRDGHAWQYVFYYIPLVFPFVGGAVALIAILRHVGAHISAISAASKSTSVTGRIKTPYARSATAYKKAFARLLAFLCTYQAMFGVVLFYKVYQSVGEDAWKKSAFEWVDCRAGWFYRSQETFTDQQLDEKCGEVPDDRFPLILLYLVIWSSAGSGISLFLVFGTTSRHLRVWKRLLERQGLVWWEQRHSRSSGDNTRTQSSAVSTGSDDDSLMTETGENHTAGGRGGGGFWNVHNNRWGNKGASDGRLRSPTPPSSTFAGSYQEEKKRGEERRRDPATGLPLPQHTYFYQSKGRGVVGKKLFKSADDGEEQQQQESRGAEMTSETEARNPTRASSEKARRTVRF